MTLEEFKEQFKFTPEEEVQYEKQKKRNLRLKNFFESIKRHCFGILFVSLMCVNILPLYIVLITSIVFVLLGIYFNKKHELYETIVHVNNMSIEYHYKFFESLDDEA